MHPTEASVRLTPGQTSEILLDRIQSFAPAHEPRRTLEYVGLEEEARDKILFDHAAASLEELSGPEIGSLIDRLQEATGGSRPPSESQLEYIETLAGEIGMTESEAAALVDASDYSELTGGSDGTASDLIEELLERRPPTEKQLVFIEDLAEEAGLDEAEACELVGEESYEALSGGQEGTASELIEVLKERGVGE